MKVASWRLMTTGLVVALAAVLTACGSEDPPPRTGTSVTVTTVTAESREGADAALTVCQQTITSAGVMVRDYNSFINALNDTQDYSKLDTQARYARETLDTGARLIRESMTPALPSDIEAKTQDFITVTEQLSEQIGAKRKAALNRATAEWGNKRTDLIDACGEFMPTGG